MATNLELTNTK